MQFRLCATFSMWLVASASMAQSVPSTPPNASDSWSTHPASSSTVYNGRSSMSAPKTKEHFKFKDKSYVGPADQPPPSANDKSAVMGTDRAWQNGQPPVDCGTTPHAAGCH